MVDDRHNARFWEADPLVHLSNRARLPQPTGTPVADPTMAVGHETWGVPFEVGTLGMVEEAHCMGVRYYDKDRVSQLPDATCLHQIRQRWGVDDCLSV